MKTEYYDAKTNWVLYLVRPFTLFGASLWYNWYASDKIKEIIGINLPDALFIEEHKGIVRYYRPRKSQKVFDDAVNKLLQDTDKCIKICEKGILLDKKSEEILAKGPDFFKNLKSAVDFVTDLGLYATVFPFRILNFLDESGIKNDKLKKLCEGLRAKENYPLMIRKIIIPLAKIRLLEMGIDSPKVLENVTLTEILNKKIDVIKHRIKSMDKDKRYIYQISDNVEKVIFVDNISTAIENLEGIPENQEISELEGQSAYKGKATGIARIILSDNPENITFDKGDIIVTIHSSPLLMPLLRKCSAIVADEGGIACHAAIVSRELKKPCVMGTKHATRIIHDGDELEVDANKGIVKIVKKYPLTKNFLKN